LEYEDRATHQVRTKIPALVLWRTFVAMPSSYRAPGRVNLMGDHTDYNDGFVLPMAIDRECVVVWSPGADGAVRARSEQLAGSVTVAADGRDDPRTVEPAWGRFVAGALRVVTERGGIVAGANLEITSSVPPGSGLSSSSALSVALTLTFAERGGLTFDPIEAARLALAAEVAATGVPGGLMDQLAALCGRAEHALLIDCRSLAIEPVPIAPDLGVLVVHCGLPRTLAGSAYAERRAECERVAAQLGIPSLRDATAAQVTDEPRARHVVSENARVLAAAPALADGDLARLGQLLSESHASLRDDYDVSTPELDRLVELLVDCGAVGARLTGAGFGGCVVAVGPHADGEAVLQRAMARYRADTGLEPSGFVAQAVDGAATSARGAGPSSPRTPPR
jgi:galactokinase